MFELPNQFWLFARTCTMTFLKRTSQRIFLIILTLSIYILYPLILYPLSSILPLTIKCLQSNNTVQMNNIFATSTHLFTYVYFPFLISLILFLTIISPTHRPVSFHQSSFPSKFHLVLLNPNFPLFYSTPLFHHSHFSSTRPSFAFVSSKFEDLEI